MPYMIMNADHSHKVSEAEVKFSPKQSIVDKAAEKEIGEMVALNITRKKIQQLHCEKTDKAILMKDIATGARRQNKVVLQSTQTQAE